MSKKRIPADQCPLPIPPVDRSFFAAPMKSQASIGSMTPRLARPATSLGVSMVPAGSRASGSPRARWPSSARRSGRTYHSTTPCARMSSAGVAAGFEGVQVVLRAPAQGDLGLGAKDMVKVRSAVVGWNASSLGWTKTSSLGIPAAWKGTHGPSIGASGLTMSLVWVS